MQADESFFNAEFFKFVNKLNRFLAVSELSIINFKYEKSGFVEISIWDEKNKKGEVIFTNISKEGALHENIYAVHEE